MTLSISQISLPVFIRHLEGLSIVLKKAQALYGEKKFDEATLLSYRLYPDMFSFARQVQAATDHARNCIALLAGVEAPKVENERKKHRRSRRAHGQHHCMAQEHSARAGRWFRGQECDGENGGSRDAVHRH